MTNADVLRKLIGPIKPVGKSEVDAERLANLEILCQTIDSLLMDIDDIVYNNRNDHEGSIKTIRSFAKSFITELFAKYKDEYSPSLENKISPKEKMNAIIKWLEETHAMSPQAKYELMPNF